eukprot:763345-Hanusia_phi.AAC.2
MLSTHLSSTSTAVASRLTFCESRPPPIHRYSPHSTRHLSSSVSLLPRPLNFAQRVKVVNSSRPLMRAEEEAKILRGRVKKRRGDDSRP